jgi:hypothetical protein
MTSTRPRILAALQKLGISGADFAAGGTDVIGLDSGSGVLGQGAAYAKGLVVRMSAHKEEGLF